MKRGALWAELAIATAIFVGCNVWHVLPIGETPWILMLVFLDFVPAVHR